MHELSLAISTVRIIEKEALKMQAKKVTTVTLEIGDCSGVDKNIFDFSWPIAVKNTILQDANKIVERVEGKAICRKCNQKFLLQKAYDPCPSCGSYLYDVLQGKELRIKSIAII